jgi:hypothetical protein
MNNIQFYNFLKMYEENYSPDIRVFSYRGRGMYDSKCVAISTNADAFHISAELMFSGVSANGEQSKLIEIFSRTRSDSFGKRNMFYWPSMEWDGNLMAESE